MARVMRTYHERWRFRHPSSDDFYAVANEIAGQDLTWFFKQAVETPAVLDYDVSSVTSERVRKPRGMPASGEPSADRDASSRALRGEDDPSAPYETTVIVRRRGEFVFPVDVAFKFVGKPAERTRWDGVAPWKRYRFIRPERLEWADIDPDRQVILDVDWSNNARRVEADRRVAAKWTTRWLFWVQNALSLVGW
jgi:hypothetical protein